MRRHLFSATALVLLIAAPVMAADTDGRFAIKGGGLQSCGQFLTAWDQQSSDLALYGGWVDGYVTGMNQTTAGIYDLMPWQNAQTLLGLTKSVCDQMPGDARFMDAFHQVVRLAATSPLTAESPVIGLNHDGRTAVLYSDTLIALKQRLTEEGFTPGPADDSFGPVVARAIGNWQEANGLPRTGLPDQETLFRLLMKRPPAQ